ncbi:hypothetical protein FB639_001679 [Coemansia asiatica]|nr:hypothetical protein FB639_001679 [Coemansia asiatica]
MSMQLNTRIDQSLDDIIKEDRKLRSTKGGKAKSAAKPKAKIVSAKKAATIAGRPARRVKNKVTAISTSDLAKKSSKNNIAARLGTPALKANSGRVASGRVGSMAGRIGKVNRVEAGRSAGAAEKKKKAAELRSRISKVAEQKKLSTISIKGEAGPATIFISNLDTEASAEDVKICFKQFGAIKDCTLLTCLKGDKCQFRHSEGARQTTDICPAFKETGQCPEKDCGRRHTVEQIARTTKGPAEIPCRNEENGGVCTRSDCIFKHSRRANPPTIAGTRPPRPSSTTSSDSASNRLNAGAKAFVPIGKLGQQRPPVRPRPNMEWTPDSSSNKPQQTRPFGDKQWRPSASGGQEDFAARPSPMRPFANKEWTPASAAVSTNADSSSAGTNAFAKPSAFGNKAFTQNPFASKESAFSKTKPSNVMFSSGTGIMHRPQADMSPAAMSGITDTDKDKGQGDNSYNVNDIVDDDEGMDIDNSQSSSQQTNTPSVPSKSDSSGKSSSLNSTPAKRRVISDDSDDIDSDASEGKRVKPSLSSNSSAPPATKKPEVTNYVAMFEKELADMNLDLSGPLTNSPASDRISKANIKDFYFDADLANILSSKK